MKKLLLAGLVVALLAVAGTQALAATKRIRVGDNVLIGANAVVLQDVPPDSVAVGIPGRVFPRRDVDGE